MPSDRRTVYTPQHGASPSASRHDTPSLPVHVLPAQHGTIPSSSHHSTPSPPGYVYPHEHGIRPSSSHHAPPSPSAHPAHSPVVGDEHTSTSRRPPTPHRTSSARSSTDRLRSSIQPAIEEIPDFFRPPTTPTKGENPLIHLIAEHGLLHPSSVAAGKMSLVFKSEYLKEGWKWEYVPQSQRDIYWLRWKEKKLKRRPTRKEMFRHLHTHGHDGQTFVDQRSAKIDIGGYVHRSPDTSIDEDAVYLEVVPEVKGRVYGLGSQGYHRSISSGEASSSRGLAYGPHELEELQRDHQWLQETLLNERMER
ncbi:hypothetical protein Scep_022260 [Stephania cephalantha]|uniref:Uncharacterized protein n=1 Tax=Stephania cephalantha TaxID=152367 RepID=A0AAP0F616_9MAGN